MSTAEADSLTLLAAGAAQARALAEVTAAITQAGDPDRAEALARTIHDPDDKADMLAALAGIAAQAGHRDRAFRLAAEAEALARTITNPDDQAWALRTLATAIAQAGDPDRAEALARTIHDPGIQADTLTGLTGVAAQSDDLDRASRLFALALVMDPLDTWWVVKVSRFSRQPLPVHGTSSSAPTRLRRDISCPGCSIKPKPRRA